MKMKLYTFDCKTRGPVTEWFVKLMFIEDLNDFLTCPSSLKTNTQVHGNSKGRL